MSISKDALVIIAMEKLKLEIEKIPISPERVAALTEVIRVLDIKY